MQKPVRAAIVLGLAILLLAACSSQGDGTTGAPDGSAAGDDGGAPGDAIANADGAIQVDGAGGAPDGAGSTDSGRGDTGPPVDTGFVCRPNDQPCGDDGDCCLGVCQSVGRICGCSPIVGSKCDRGPDCCPGMGCSLDTARCAYGGGHPCVQNTDCLSGYCPNGTCA